MNVAYLETANFPTLPTASATDATPLHSKPRVGPTGPPLEVPIQLPAIPVDPMLTTKQAATILGVEAETMKKWRQRDGKGLSFVKYPDGAIRYRLSTILKFLEDCTVER